MKTYCLGGKNTDNIYSKKKKMIMMNTVIRD